MSLDKHISPAVKTRFLQLRECRHIRTFFPKSAAITLVNVSILYRIDYYNTFLWSSKVFFLHRFQKVRNYVALIILICSSHFSHITPILKSLHWFPVKYRINFELCSKIHRAFSLEEPYYLNSLLIHWLNSLYLRSSSFTLLCYHFSTKFQMVFFFLFLLKHFFEIIYFTLFVLHLHTYLLQKILKNFFQSSNSHIGSVPCINLGSSAFA